MPTAEELIVSLKSEGAEQTQEQIDGVEDKTRETTDALEDSAEEAQGFATKFRGAFGALTAGLAVAAGGLLTQVPILQESFDALGVVATEAGLALDNALRGTLSDINNEIISIGEKIDPKSDFMSNLGTLSTELGRLGAVTLGLSIQDIAKGEMDLGDLLVITGTTIAAAKLIAGITGATFGARKFIAGITAITVGAATILKIKDKLGLDADSVLSMSGALGVSAALFLTMTGFLPVSAGAVLFVTGALTLFAEDILKFEGFKNTPFSTDMPSDSPGASTPGGNMGGPGLDEPLPPGADPIPRVGVNPTVNTTTGSQDTDVILDGQSVVEKNARINAGKSFIRGGTR